MTKTQEKTSTDLVQQQRDLVAFVDDAKLRQELTEILPPTVTPAAFIRGFKNAALANPDILTAERRSLYLALLRAASAELIPDGNEGAIVMFKGQAQFLAMIAGLRKRLAEFGWSLTARIVHENDTYDPDYENQRANFRPARLGTPAGAIVGAFAVAQHRDGRRAGPIAMTVDEIEYVRSKSKSPNSPGWTQWWDRMAEKTVARRLVKEIPLDPKDRERLQTFITDDENGDVDGDELVNRLYGAAPSARAPEPSEEDNGGYDEPIDVEAEEITEDSGTPAPEAEAAQPDPQEQQAAQSAEAPPETASADAPFDGEEPPEDPVEEPRFESGRYAGKTPSEILEVGEKGATYLRWALSSWKTPTMKAFLEGFAEQHPEIKP